MNSQELKARIDKNKEKLIQKVNLIDKKKKQISKREKLVFPEDSFDKTWNKCQIEDLENGIKKLVNETIPQLEETIKKQELQLQKKQNQEQIISEQPSVLKDLAEQLNEKLIKTNIKHRETLQKEYEEKGYKDFCKKYDWKTYNSLRETDCEIEKRVKKDVEHLILDLIYRVTKITGKITDYSHVRLTYPCVLNGYVVGESGVCEIESIIAGGWNIQKEHYRVLVKRIKIKE